MFLRTPISLQLSFRYLLLVGLFLSSCAPARRPFAPGEIPAPKVPTISDEQYGHEVVGGLSERFPLEYNDPRMDKIQEIVDRLTAAAHADQDPWHVYLFRDDAFKNAAATRGNHVFVWTGLLNSVKNDGELATIIAHEIAHVLARHTDPDPNEELKKMLVGLGAMAAEIAVSYGTRGVRIGGLGDLTNTVTQHVGEGLLLNPYSKDLELEADQIGFFLMADAGYDPKDALEFWRRAEFNPDFDTGPSFFSTHPPAEDRLANLEKLLPAAEERYKNHGVVPSSATASASIANGTAFSTSLSPTTLPFISQGGWRVTGDEAIVYSKPDRKSKAVGEFVQGAVFEGVPHGKNWIEVKSPDHGFVQRSTVKAN